MNLHENREIFLQLIRLAAAHFNMATIYIEKDYWLSYSLQRMAKNKNADKVVFKGGTALAKAYRLTNRFSEDIDIAVIEALSMTGNQLKMLIKRLAKDMADGLEENVVKGITSKGSRFYKTIYNYPSIVDIAQQPTVKQGQMLIEINTYANPYPYIKQEITSFIADYLASINRHDLVEQSDLKPFIINVLDKRRTIVEKTVSLLRFSFSENITVALSGKIRHFYDLYYLLNANECAEYVKSSAFYGDLQELFANDQKEFDTPLGWTEKTIAESPLLYEFPTLWQSLRLIYQTELRPLAYTEIPDEKNIENTILQLIERIKEGS